MLHALCGSHQASAYCHPGFTFGVVWRCPGVWVPGRLTGVLHKASKHVQQLCSIEWVYAVQGTSAISKASDYPRSNPQVVKDQVLRLGPGVAYHVSNSTSWCWEAEDIERWYAHV